MKNLIEDHLELVVIGALMLILVPIIWWVVVASNAEYQQFQDECGAMGGTVVEDTSSGTGINPSNGQPVVTTSTTYFCLSEDGRILGIR